MRQGVNAGWGQAAFNITPPSPPAEGAVSPPGLVPRQRVGPDFGPVVVEHQRRVLRHGHPHPMRQLVLELRRRPARIAESEQAFLRAFAETDVADGAERARERRPNPGTYEGALQAVAELVQRVRQQSGAPSGPVGVGVPGSVSPTTGLMRGASLRFPKARPR